MGMAKVLLVEDDPRVREVVATGLGGHGFIVTAAPDGASGLEMLSDDVDIVLLDLMLPGMGGMEVLAEIRSSRPRLPVVMLTAVDGIDSKVDGLDAGADDYITKPFSIDEVAARLRARLRRQDDPVDILTVGPVTVDVAAHQVLVYDKEVPLSARELGLLTTFMNRCGELLTRDEILRLVWNIDFDPGSNVVEVYVRALRQKIGSEFIATVRGEGYKFVSPEANVEESV